MVISFLSPAAQGGGAETALLDLIASLRQSRPEWILHLIAGEDGPMLSKARTLGVSVEVLPFPERIRVMGEQQSRLRLGSTLRAGFATLAYVYGLHRRLNQLSSDIVHSNGMKMHLLASLSGIAKRRKRHLIWHFHDYLGTRSKMAPILRCLSRWCDLVIANSESVAADARKLLPKRLPVHRVYNSVDMATFSPDGPRLDLEKLGGLPTDNTTTTVRVGLVATFAKWKGHEVFLRAVANLRRRNLPKAVRFYVVGGPVYATIGSQHTFEHLKALAEDLKISEQLVFTGFVDDPASAIRALDIVVHASTQPEPFGLVIVQALACGRALVASNAGGAKELFEAGRTALIHAPGNAEELADAIERLILDEGLRRRLGAAGRKAVVEQFNPSQMIAGLTPLYQELVARVNPT